MYMYMYMFDLACLFLPSFSSLIKKCIVDLKQGKAVNPKQIKCMS